MKIIFCVTILTVICGAFGGDDDNGLHMAFGSPQLSKLLEIAAPVIALKVKAESVGKCDQAKFMSCQVSGNNTISAPNCCTFYASNKFLECLGGEECLSIGELYGIGFTFLEATFTHYLTAKTKYDCSEKAINIRSSNYSCIVETAMDTHIEDLYGCSLIMSFANAQNICLMYKEYVQCVKEVFVGACGAAVGTMSCESSKVLSDIIFPSCKLNCGA